MAQDEAKRIREEAASAATSSAGLQAGSGQGASTALTTEADLTGIFGTGTGTGTGAPATEGAAAEDEDPSTANERSYAEEIRAGYAAAAQQQAAETDAATEAAIAQKQADYAEASDENEADYRSLTGAMYTGMDNQALQDDLAGRYGGSAAENLSTLAGIYQAQRAAIARQQQTLAANTQREVEALRAQGEFDQADALLKTRQQELQALYQEAVRVSENITANAQFAAQQSQKAEAAASAREESRQAALQEVGLQLLSTGVMPTDAMLEAMGIDAATAQQVVAAAKRGLI